MTIFTIGHYNYNLETFLEMLEKAKITKIIDVRSFQIVKNIHNITNMTSWIG
ncbi:hypothetical protein [Staphylococcus cohnii]|uniref:hypothetical protein n=1 Tax=Staphylococcus cohnii TaxID=29382 RepID=UPI003CF0BCE5